MRVVTRGSWADLPDLIRGCDAVLHLAGVNRGEDSVVENMNIQLAEDLAAALPLAARGVRVVYANSIHAGNGTPYGNGKATAATVLGRAAHSTGGALVDVVLPNLFGEHGRPRYNSFVATFVEAVVSGGTPAIRDNRVPLLHAQLGAQALMDALDGPGRRTHVAAAEHGVWRCGTFSTSSRRPTLHGEIPDLSSPFRVALFNTYRAALFPAHAPLELTPHSDARGTFVETLRSRGGQGQTSFSTTVPGVTRGEHYHLRKVERFAVIAGAATMSLRRMFTDDVVDVAVTGEEPAAVDMPVGWVHNITNTGDDVLLTQFWSHELFIPDDPDTYPEGSGRTPWRHPDAQGHDGGRDATELIRLSRVIVRLDETVHHVLVHTGQNYDFQLNEVFFRDLGLRRPDHMLGVDTSTLGTVLGGTLIAAERVLLEERPDAVLVLGDTNSAIAALMARRLQIPVYHMEAGNRCFDMNVPEETNRRLLDHIADFNLVYTEHARRNLLAEGIHPRRILKTGSPMREVLDAYRADILASDILEELALTEGGYFLVSAHREENVDRPDRLRSLLSCLNAVHAEWQLPIHVSTHPRTRRRLEALREWEEPEGVTFGEPLGFHDYNRLQLSAACCLSDSGTIAEESTLLGFPAVTLRNSIERPEALDTGGIIMTGLNPDNVVEAVRVAMASDRPRGSVSELTPEDYLVTNTSERTVSFLVSTIRQHHDWAGIRRG